MISLAPSRAKITAAARPIPDPAPVMIAVLPRSYDMAIPHPNDRRFSSTTSKTSRLSVSAMKKKLRANWFILVTLSALMAGCFFNPQRSPQDLGGEHVSFTTSDGVLLRGH